jgi:NAD(P)H-nitrite reductase large subunit
MEKTDILIIGGGIAGVSAAETVRRLAPERSVTLIEHENHPLYSRVMLRDYVSGTIRREKVFLRTLRWYRTKGIVYLPGTTVSRLDLDAHTAELSSGRTLRYQRLLLATGGYPRPWNIAGADLLGVLRFQTIEDADALKAACNSAKHAVVVGGGFIGLDFVQAFVRAGVPTTVLVLEPRYWLPLLDAESSGLVTDVLRKSGATVQFNAEVGRVVGSPGVEGVILKDGAEFPADAVGVGIGIVPDFGFLSGSGVEIGSGIRVNAFLETGRSEVLAAGDAADFEDVTVGVRHRLGNWTNAVGHGLAAGRTLAGTRTRYEAVSAYTVEYLGLPVAFVGDCHPHPDNVDVVRGSRALGAIARFILRHGRLVGATLLNRSAERVPVAALIRSAVDVTSRTTDLADPGFPLATLVPKP